MLRGRVFRSLAVSDPVTCARSEIGAQVGRPTALMRRCFGAQWVTMTLKLRPSKRDKEGNMSSLLHQRSMASIIKRSDINPAFRSARRWPSTIAAATLFKINATEPFVGVHPRLIPIESMETGCSEAHEHDRNE